MSLDPARPFILLDDAALGMARLFEAPEAIVSANSIDAVVPALEQLRAAQRAGFHAAGYISYEAGLALEPRLRHCRHAAPPPEGMAPLLWFGLFRGWRALDPATLDAPEAAITALRPRATPEAYAAAVDQVRAYIAAGDIYQANLTFAADIAYEGHPLGLYLRLRRRQQAPYGALIRHDSSWLLSFSPELFFDINGDQLRARPMKGTAPRGGNAKTDAEIAARLAADSKNRAENLMIVDLLRNDLARVAAPGSVTVPRLFSIETYPTLHQMTSEVTARLAPGCDAVAALTALFPCGSITGAPKLRAMEIIDALEPEPRGPYTGAIGHIAPDGTAAFNVTIRTLAIDRPGHARLGLGAGIVADSDPQAEWRECLSKGDFLTRAPADFDLIETLRFDPADGFLQLDRHLMRLSASAARFDFPYSEHVARNQLQAAVAMATTPRRVRLLLGRNGGMAVETAPLPPAPDTPVAVVATPLPVPAEDIRLAHKTTDRSFYAAALAEARAQAPCFETVLVRPDGFVTEGSFTNIFLRRADDMLLTPPLHDGLLPGILRGALIDSGQAIEARLTLADLADGFYIGNALRGLIPARLVAPV